jgi:phytoene dehydrogenase-like protein
MPDPVVPGAGMAGLVAIAETLRLGAEVLVFEKLDLTWCSSASRTG